MHKLLQRLFLGLLFLLIFMVVPATSISQDQKGTSLENPDSKIGSADIGGLSLDELKAQRATVESADNVGDSIKKTVLSLLDQAIGSLERQAQLSKKTEEIAQTAQNAPQRIKEIEAELDHPPVELEPIEKEVLTMERSQLELKIQNIEADLAAARTN